MLIARQRATPGWQMRLCTDTQAFPCPANLAMGPEQGHEEGTQASSAFEHKPANEGIKLNLEVNRRLGDWEGHTEVSGR